LLAEITARGGLVESAFPNYDAIRRGSLWPMPKRWRTIRGDFHPERGHVGSWLTIIGIGRRPKSIARSTGVRISGGS